MELDLVLAQAECVAESAVCSWLDAQGLPDWAVAALGGVLGPVLKALVILVVTAVIAFVVRRLVRRAGQAYRDSPTTAQLGRMGGTPDLRRTRRIDSLTEVADSIAFVVVWSIGLMTAISAFGVDLAPLIASAGIVGVALGFGAQSLVKDFLSGMFMLAEDQFGVGDIIDVGEASGLVEDITLRTTSLRGVDGTLWFVPNGEILRVGNMSQDWARALLDISVAYGADIDAATDVIARAAREFAAQEQHADLILEEPELLGVEDLGADAVVIRLWIKTKPGEQWNLSRELRRQIKLALDANDIPIPFPQRTVWLRHDDEAAARTTAAALRGRGAPTDAASDPTEAAAAAPDGHQPG